MTIGTSRLLHLAEAMDNFKELGKPHGIDKFNINRFICGSSACALGLAGLVPQFISDGLKMTVRREYYGTDPLVEFEFENSYGGHAIAEFFGITVQDVDDLFYPHIYDPQNDSQTEHEMAASIRTFVANSAHL